MSRCSVAALQLQGPRFDLELTYSLFEVLHVLPASVRISSGFLELNVELHLGVKMCVCMCAKCPHKDRKSDNFGL